jgi:hypothetical protein
VLLPEPFEGVDLIVCETADASDVVVLDLERAYRLRGCLEVAQLHDGVACVAMNEDDTASASAQPCRAVHICQGEGLAAVTGARAFRLVVQDDDVHAVHEAGLYGTVDGTTNLIIGEPERCVFQAVEDDSAGVGSGSEAEQDEGVLGDVLGRWSLPDHQPLGQGGTVPLADHPRE